MNNIENWEQVNAGYDTMAFLFINAHTTCILLSMNNKGNLVPFVGKCPNVTHPIPLQGAFWAREPTGELARA